MAIWSIRFNDLHLIIVLLGLDIDVVQCWTDGEPEVIKGLDTCAIGRVLLYTVQAIATVR